jgi:hypothetical protein
MPTSRSLTALVKDIVDSRLEGFFEFRAFTFEESAPDHGRR